MSAGVVRYVVRYSGRVQGVGFRMTAVAQGRGLAIHGFVRNEPDGSVLMDVEGPAGDMKELMRRIDSAMRGHIDGTDTDHRPPRDRDGGFQITY